MSLKPCAVHRKPRPVIPTSPSQPRELCTWLTWRANYQPDQAALWIHDGTAPHVRNWSQIAADVRRAAAAFDSLGIRPGDRVVQMAENRVEWLVTDLALLSLGAVHVPLHVNLPAWQAARQVLRADSQWFVVSTATLGCAIQSELRKLREANSRSTPNPDSNDEPRLIVYSTDDDARHDEAYVEAQNSRRRDAQPHKGVAGNADEPPLVLATLIANADPNRGARAITRAAEQIREDTPATILFTSGTLGDPKGVVLTHGNLSANVRGIQSAFHERPSERRICALPLSHIYARTCDLYAWLLGGGELALARRPDTLLADCQAFRPTFLNGVPYLFDRIRRKWLAESASSGGASSGGASSGVTLRDLFGGQIELCVCGGAALADDVFDFYHDHGVPLLPGYGLTEASPVVTASTLSSVRRGCVGRPIPDVEVRVATDGEILTRGPHVTTGYWRDSAATTAAFHDGWLHTGDLGEWDSDGFLRIVGRKKELIVLSTGKNVAPAPLEALLASDPWIASAIVFGEGRAHLVALITPQPEVLARLAAQLGLTASPPGELARLPAVHALFAQRIERLNERLAPHEQVRRFALTDRPFSLERDELTAKLTLRRTAIERNCAAVIAALYDCQRAESASLEESAS